MENNYLPLCFGKRFDPTDRLCALQCHVNGLCDLKSRGPEAAFKISRVDFAKQAIKCCSFSRKDIIDMLQSRFNLSSSAANARYANAKSSVEQEGHRVLKADNGKIIASNLRIVKIMD